MAKQATPEVLEAIKNVVEYCWDQECDDFQEQVDNYGIEASEDHVFVHLVALDNWLNGTNKKPSDYIEGIDPDDPCQEEEEEEGEE